ncbi:MAG: glycosyltransferase family 39 protein, partial [Maribacter sp.]
RRIFSIALGAFGAGIAFSTKGQIALLVIGLPLLCHIWYTRKWKVFLNWKVIFALLVFGITIAPMLYAYYHQFDLHPEKIIRGKSDRSGIFFIFWEQSFERLSGEGIGKNSSDYFFFFHTFLWVFIPWTVIALVAYWSRAKSFFKLKFVQNSKYEFLPLGGITFVFILISFAQFKLPHYLNVTIPLFSILTASYLYEIFRFDKKKTIRLLLRCQYFILGIVFIACSLICFFVFRLTTLLAYVVLIIAGIIVIYYALKREGRYMRLITISVCASLLLNTVLNLHFYPNLLNYQGGSSMAKLIKENNVPVDNIYKIGEDYTWALDFYNKNPVQLSDLEMIKKAKDVWVYANMKELEELRTAGIDWDKQYSVKQFRITRLQEKFLNPNTRYKVLNEMYLVHVY